MTSSKNDLNQGYQKYSKDYQSKLKLNNSESVDVNDSKKNKKSSIRYPHGYFTVFFISLITLGVFLLAYLINWINVDVVDSSNNVVGHEKITIQKKVVDCLAIAFAVGFFLNLVWLLSRQTTSLKFKYSSRKMMEIFTFKDQRKRKNMTFSTLAVNNINNFSDYQKFCEMKKLTTALVFWISFCIYTMTFIITTIVSLTT